MTRKDVTAIGEVLGMRITWTPEGGAIAGVDSADWLIRSGSGIAGKGGEFFLWNTRTGDKTAVAKTRRQMRRLLVEYSAGSRPKGARFARWNPNAFDHCAKWVY